VWATVTCSYSDWSRRYKHQYPAHNHDEAKAFVVTAKNDAVAELQGSGQARFANVTSNQLGTTALQTNMANDPGQGYKQI
jgi:hypothetical protein